MYVSKFLSFLINKFRNCFHGLCKLIIFFVGLGFCLHWDSNFYTIIAYGFWLCSCFNIFVWSPWLIFVKQRDIFWNNFKYVVVGSLCLLYPFILPPAVTVSIKLQRISGPVIKGFVAILIYFWSPPFYPCWPVLLLGQFF